MRLIPSYDEIITAKDTVTCLFELGLESFVANRGFDIDNFLVPSGIYLLNGCSKICVFTTDLPNWVIKVGYTGYTELDLCRKEAEIYETAAFKGIEDYFASTYYLGEINGHSYCLQERVDVDIDANSEELMRYIAFNQRGYEGDDWEEDYVDNEQEYEDLLEFIDFDDFLEAVYGHHIKALINLLEEFEVNDMNDGGYGYIEGHPVLVDFSGYY